MSSGTQWVGFEDEDQPDADDSVPVTPRLGSHITSKPARPAPAPAPVAPPPPELTSIVNNKYRHCGSEWESIAGEASADTCACCGEQVEPYESEEL